MSAQREAFARAIASWNAGDLDASLELYDEQIALHEGDKVVQRHSAADFESVIAQITAD